MIVEWGKCHCCGRAAPPGVAECARFGGLWRDVTPSSTEPNEAVERWEVLECSGGGCGDHFVCPACAAQFGFVNVLHGRYVRCPRHLTDDDLILASLRGGP